MHENIDPVPDEPFYHLLLPHYFQQKSSSSSNLSCPGCGQSQQTFQQHPRATCDQCYDTFYQETLELCRQIQGATQHHGKTPRSTSPDLSQEILRLEGHLKEVVEQEDYEQAIFYRDAILRLKKQVEADEQ